MHGLDDIEHVLRRCGRCKFDENPRSYMRDDTECEKCSGTEGPAIIAATVIVPILAVGVPLAVLRFARTRAVVYRVYHRAFDVGKCVCARESPHFTR